MRLLVKYDDKIIMIDELQAPDLLQLAAQTNMLFLKTERLVNERKRIDEVVDDDIPF